MILVFTKETVEMVFRKIHLFGYAISSVLSISGVPYLAK
jgi:hypothetical protein